MRNLFIKFVMVLLGLFIVSSCVKDNEFANNPDKQQQYENAFVNAFGNVNDSVNWGFDNMSINVVKDTKDNESNAAAKARRAHNVNRNQWGTDQCAVNVPVNVTPNERQLVYNYFNVKRVSVVNQNNVIWTDYFISEVWKGTSVYKDGFGNDVLGSDKMNHLQVLKGNGSINSDGALVGNWEHANDFNNGNHNSSFGTIEGHTFMYNSGTYDFAYHNAVDSKYHNEYIIIPGSEIDPSLAGYYYVGFDFYATHPTGQDSNKNMDVERDWFFTDWIVRISPAEYMNTKRIMVEDLIDSSLEKVDVSDWDFNDAVFDIAFVRNQDASYQTHDYAVITLWAAGGTKALTISGKEAHELFHEPTSKMINTNANGGVDGKAPVIFRLDMGQTTDYNKKYNAAIDIVVKVNGTELTAGKATQKFAVPVGTHWMKESKLITVTYKKFSNYVQNNSPEDWYNTITNESNLY